MTHSEIKQWLERFKIKNYSIREDGVVDVAGNVDLANKGITSLPFKFGKVEGDFYISFNNIKDLINHPDEVIGVFDCSYNRGLTSFKGAPNFVHSYVECSGTSATTLEGFENTEVGGDFDCSHNPHLISLQGSPKRIDGDFYCAFCEKLKNFEHSTTELGGDFDNGEN